MHIIYYNCFLSSGVKNGQSIQKCHSKIICIFIDNFNMHFSDFMIKWHLEWNIILTLVTISNYKYKHFDMKAFIILF